MRRQLTNCLFILQNSTIHPSYTPYSHSSYAQKFTVDGFQDVVLVINDDLYCVGEHLVRVEERRNIPRWYDKINYDDIISISDIDFIVLLDN